MMRHGIEVRQGGDAFAAPFGARQPGPEGGCQTVCRTTPETGPAARRPTCQHGSSHREPSGGATKDVTLQCSRVHLITSMHPAYVVPDGRNLVSRRSPLHSTLRQKVVSIRSAECHQKIEERAPEGKSDRHRKRQTPPTEL